MSDNKTEKKPRFKSVIEAADHLSLGISIVVAIAIGVGLGLFFQRLSGSNWGLGIGIFIGVGAAILNIYKAYSKDYKEYQKMAKDPKYNIEELKKKHDKE